MSSASAISRPSLEDLKRLIHRYERRMEHRSFSFSEDSEGIPFSALTEVSSPDGGGKTRFVLSFLAEWLVSRPSQPRIAWVESGDCTLYPPVLLQRGIALHHVLFIDAGEQWAWAVSQVLRSRLFSVVALTLSEAAIRQVERESFLLRRLQIEAERTEAAVLVLSSRPVARGGWVFARRVRR